MEAVTRRKIDQCLPLSQAVLSLFAILIAINVIRAMVGIYKCHTVSDWLADNVTLCLIGWQTHWHLWGCHSISNWLIYQLSSVLSTCNADAPASLDDFLHAAFWKYYWSPRVTSDRTWAGEDDLRLICFKTKLDSNMCNMLLLCII